MNNNIDGRLTREGIRIHDRSDFAGMRKAGELAARILDDVSDHVFVGQTTGAIDDFIQSRVEEAGATVTDIATKESSLEDLFTAYTTESDDRGVKSEVEA